MALTQATDVWDTVSVSAIAQTLGAAKRSPLRTERELLEETRAGLPVDVIAALQRVGFSIDELARVTANSSRTINRLVARRKEKARLNVATSNAAVRLATVVTLGELLLGSRERIVAWLRAPNRYLGGVEPLALLETEMGRDIVLESLYAVAFGGVA